MQLTPSLEFVLGLGLMDGPTARGASSDARPYRDHDRIVGALESPLSLPVAMSLRAAEADSGISLPKSRGAHPARKVTHSVKHRMHFRDNIFAVHNDGRLAR